MKRARRVAGLALLALWCGLAVVACAAVHMPGESYRGASPPLDARERHIADTARADVTMLAATIGPRSSQQREELERAEAFVVARFTALGYAVTREAFVVDGATYDNVIAERRGGGSNSDEIVVIGGHYDSVPSTPGADDNASGVAALLGLAEAFAKKAPSRTVRFVAFTNEEPPFFKTDAMGSRINAQRAHQRGDHMTSMLSLESAGTFSDAFPSP